MAGTNNPLASTPAGEFESLTRLPVTNFLTKNIPAPTLVYTGTDSFLRVTVRNSSAGVTLTFRTRMLLSDNGAIVTSEDTFTPDSTGNQLVVTLPLTEGFLLSVLITSDGGLQLRGQTFVSMELCHGTQSAPHRDSLLIQDYVASGYAASWPNGQIRLATEGPGCMQYFTLGNPGPGFELFVGMQTGCRSAVRSFVGTFTTSAVVGNRVPVFSIKRAATFIYSVPTAVAIPASTVATIILTSAVTAPTAIGNRHMLPLPANMPVNGPPTLSTVTAGLDPGDAYTTLNMVAEVWIDS